MADVGRGIASMSSVDEIALQLENMIVEGQIRSGQKLSEIELSTRLAVGRAPLREAIRTLEGRRLVRRTPNSGVRVTQLSIADIEKVLMVREALEGMSARQAAENMTLPELRVLKAGLERGQQQETNDKAFRIGSYDNDFHVQIAKGGRNEWLADLLCRDLYALMRVIRLQSISLGRGFQEVYPEHMAIAACIEKRDPDGAEALMRKHISAGRMALLAQLRAG
jgi:DNA-binding GntR family transcriptional regulator